MKKSQRIKERQAHADAYKEGFDDGFRLGMTVEAQAHRERPPDVLVVDCDAQVVVEAVYKRLMSLGYAVGYEEVFMTVNMVLDHIEKVQEERDDGR